MQWLTLCTLLFRAPCTAEALYFWLVWLGFVQLLASTLLVVSAVTVPCCVACWKESFICHSACAQHMHCWSSHVHKHTDKSACLQTVEGRTPQGLPASELAAMFCHSVVPKLRSYYLKDPTSAHQVKAYKRKCQAFAAKLQLPKWQWPLVTLPFFISMDWDTRHTWVRQVLACPRAQDSDIGAVTQQARNANFTLPHPNHNPAEMHEQRERTASDRGGFSTVMTRHGANQSTLDQQRKLYRTAHGYDCELMALFDKAILEPEVWATLIFHQFMPLSKVSPDMHCPPEHAVGTCKVGVRVKLMECNFDDKELWKGLTYQTMLLDVIKEKLNGKPGLYQISRSVQKQPLICKILAAEQGEEVTLKYRFGQKRYEQRGTKKTSRPSRAGPADVHVVKGTGGRWIKDSKWT